MGSLIDDLLLYSHVTQMPHQMEMVDMNETVKQVLEDLELEIQEKKAVVHVAALPKMPGYRRQLQQVFQNLISNALKYSPPDAAPQVAIASCDIAREGRDYHCISVSDRGIGFDQEFSQKIFWMFSRLHARQEYSGSGVGLAIVKKVVENHDGLIEVESEKGVGSVFKIWLLGDRQ